jgi:hypothetical protein
MAENKESSQIDFNRISSTALLCARIRAKYTDIPYAKDVYELLSDVERRSNEIISPSFLEQAVNNPSLTSKVSIIEGRYLAINDSIESLTDCTILELSSGLTPRGLEFSDRSFYVETDLPLMVSSKCRIIEQVKMRKHIGSNNHRILPLNPINLSELLSLGKDITKIKDSSIVIINEGLLMYLSKTEQEQLRNNIVEFLNKYSPKGYWITTDFSSRLIKESEVETIMEKIEKETGREFNRFQSKEQVDKFLFEGGLKGTPLTNHHLIDKLSCLRKLNIAKKEAISIADRYNAWKIELK